MVLIDGTWLVFLGLDGGGRVTLTWAAYSTWPRYIPTR